MAFLDGVRVLDFSNLLPGPYCSMLLADMGAEVIKIERPGAGDGMRTLIPGMFWAANRGKKSITLNLQHPEGKEIARELARRSDVVLEGFRPGKMEHLGLAYENLRTVNEALIYCSISGYGQIGPYRDMPGHDINYLAYSGALSLPGDIEFPPIRPSIPIGDLSSAMFAAMSIVAALFRREKNPGQGEYLDVAITDALISWTSVRWGEYLERGELLGTDEMPHLSPANKVFSTKDGQNLALGALEDNFWLSLCQAIGKEDWANNPHYATNELRNINRNELLPELKRIFASKTRDEWVRILTGADVPCAPVFSTKEVIAGEYIRARNLLTELPPRGNATPLQIGYPVRFGNTSLNNAHNFPPALGQHTKEILIWLGYASDNTEDLRKSGVI